MERLRSTFSEDKQKISYQFCHVRISFVEGKVGQYHMDCQLAIWLQLVRSLTAA